jgi:hypothetical protein
VADLPFSLDAAVEAVVKVVGDDDRAYVFRAHQLSFAGLVLHTRTVHAYPFRVGTVLQLEICDYDDVVRARAAVARLVEPGTADAARHPPGFGLRLLECDDASRAAVEAIAARAAELAALG